MNKTSLLHCMIVAIMILGIVLILGGAKEGFSGASYPQNVTKGLLLGDYPTVAHPGLSNYSYSSAWRLYPTWAVGSYAQKTNNVRYWKTPCNGWTIPADMCGGQYTSKNITPPTLQSPNRCCNRVNYYCSV